MQFLADRVFYVFLQQVVGMTDGRHRVADFMRQIGGQLAERSQFGCHGFGSDFTQRAQKQHQQFAVFLHHGHGTDVHGKPMQMDVGLERFFRV